MRSIGLHISALLSVLLLAGCRQGRVVDLSGEWRFAIDSLDEGLTGEWFCSRLEDAISLPGTMLSNGKGNPVGLNTPWTGGITDKSFFKDGQYSRYRKAENFKVPFWLQPDLYYKGAAWYQKDIDIPDNWSGHDVVLSLERCHWQTMAWLDGKYLGDGNSLGTPHLYYQGNIVPGKHTITIRVDNSIHEIDPGENSHSISDHTQGNWNGIVGKIELICKPKVYMTGVQVFPSLEKNQVAVRIGLVSAHEGNEKIRYKVGGEVFSSVVQLREGDNIVTDTIVLKKKVVPWDEFTPELYDFSCRAGDDELRTRIGFRTWSVDGGELSLNGHRVFMRGTLDCGAFPLTGYPDMGREHWIKEFGKCRAFGLNHVRFHSWCPPEAAFEVADELGMYLQIECCSWANQSTTIGDGGPLDKYIMDESERIVATYGNHPSFCMLAYGNEPGGNYGPFLTGFVNHWKANDGRRLYTCASGWPQIPENDFQLTPEPRIQRWGEGLSSIINAKKPSADYDWSTCVRQFDKPVIGHEVGQWCSYPDFGEIDLYKGPYKAKNFEIFKDRLVDNGLGSLADGFLHSSGKLQTLCYKADIEAALRTPGFGGFQLLGLNDFPGQGTALVGVLNAFWEEKGYVSAGEFRRFSSEVVPLARLKKLVYESQDSLTVSFEVANFKEIIDDARITWRLEAPGKVVVKSGEFVVERIPLGSGIVLGNTSFSLENVPAPAKLRLVMSVSGYENDWNVWVFPEKDDIKDSQVWLTDKYDDETIRRLASGQDVILSPGRERLPDYFDSTIPVGFSTVFWNTAWTGGQPPHTLGIFCDPSHPMLALFPTDTYSDYQWHDPLSHSRIIRIDKVEADIAPVVYVIDDWFTARPLCILAEVKTGYTGRLVISGVDFFEDMEHRPSSRQLLKSVINYLNH